MNANRIEYRNTVALTARQNLKSPTENDSTARRSTAETLIRINQHVCRMFACNNSLRTIRFNPIAVYLVRDAGRKQRLNLFVPSRTMISHHLRSIKTWNIHKNSNVCCYIATRNADFHVFEAAIKRVYRLHPPNNTVSDSDETRRSELLSDHCAVRACVGHAQNRRGTCAREIEIRRALF